MGNIEKKEIDVFDFNCFIAEFISVGLRKYIEENKKATFPTAPSSEFLGCKENASLEERMMEWHIIIERLAEMFNELANAYYPAQEKVDSAFDGLKKFYPYLWI